MSEIRIAAGTAKGRKISVPDGLCVRPPRNMVRQAVFNIIGPEIHDARILDLYAGCGSFGIEALSRKAASAVFVEKDPSTCRILRSNLELAGLVDAATVVNSDAQAFLKQNLCKGPLFDVVFADPPYALSSGPEMIGLAATLRESVPVFSHGAILVFHAEATDAPWDLPDSLPGSVSLRKFGRNLICFARLD